jgi:hypothetical protein
MAAPVGSGAFASTTTGRLLADPVTAQAGLLSAADVARVERLLARKYRIELLVIRPIRSLQVRLRRGRPRPMLVIAPT